MGEVRTHLPVSLRATLSRANKHMRQWNKQSPLPARNKKLEAREGWKQRVGLFCLLRGTCTIITMSYYYSLLQGWFSAVEKCFIELILNFYCSHHVMYPNTHTHTPTVNAAKVQWDLCLLFFHTCRHVCTFSLSLQHCSMSLWRVYHIAMFSMHVPSCSWSRLTFCCTNTFFWEQVTKQ